MQWNENTLGGLKVGSVFRDHERPVGSLDISYDGELCVTTDSKRSIRIWDCKEAKLASTVPMHKYGCSIARFSHDKNYLLVADDCTAGSKAAPTVRLLNLAKSEYQLYYSPHELHVSYLAVSPLDDHFLSVEESGTVRIFDIRVTGPVAKLITRNQAFSSAQPAQVETRAEYTPDGLVYAVCYMEHPNVYLKLFDARKLSSGPFVTKLFSEYDRVPDCISFSRTDFVSAHRTESNTELRISDAFKLKRTNLIQLPEDASMSAESDHRMQACFAPHGRYIAAGGFDGTLKIWDSTNADLLLDSKAHPRPVRCVRWNPRFAMLVTACQTLNFWISC